jgi:peroxiredoxin
MLSRGRLLFCAVLWLGGGRAAEAEDGRGPAVAAVAFPFFLHAEGGGGPPTFRLTDFVGPTARRPRPIILSFVAPNCEGCEREMQGLGANGGEQLSALRDSDAEFWVIAVGKREERAEVVRMLVKYGVEAPVLADPVGNVALEYGVTSIERGSDGRITSTSSFPYTFLIGADGRIAWRESGFDAKGSYQRLLKALKSLAHR